MKRLEDNLSGKNDNYILPFLWVHGEDEKTLRTYVEAIDQSGVKAFCIESRPHPEFVGDRWWRDLDILLDEAEKRSMQVWILDDSHFPTGYANGAIKNHHPEKRKRYLKLHQLDFFGPMENAQAIIQYAFKSSEDSLVKVYLAQKVDNQTIEPKTMIDLTDRVEDNLLVSFDLPEGEWRLLILVATFEGGEPHTENYLNPIDPSATDVLIDTVYEAHYTHYQTKFGNTIAGFFSDEPRFGNIHGALGSIGRIEMVLPWRHDLLELLSERLGSDAGEFLPLLFVDGGEKAYIARYEYMSLVSDLYSEHFNKRLADWCHAHGVAYIGHTIEDNNAHARLGYGAGHFFKAMAHQDMAGIDVVLHQLMPGMDQHANKSITSTGWDGEFFHYALAKLGSSLGHMDSRKKGRVLCEVFGAYGWAEGNRMMKWIVDHMLVRGVNHFVPHAFTGKSYPDPDCPPHFYAHGKNPQYPEFKQLMTYTNRMSHLLTDGVHRAPAAILYHAEAEWSGDYMYIQKPAAVLTKNQIDFDILPISEVIEAKIEAQKLCVSNERFNVLIVPYAQALPKKLIEALIAMATHGVRVFFIDSLPSRLSETEGKSNILTQLALQKGVCVVPLETLAQKVLPYADIRPRTYVPYLRYYHHETSDANVYFFVNEHPYHPIETVIETRQETPFWRYDALSNQRFNETEDFQNPGDVKIKLEPYASTVIVYPKAENAWHIETEKRSLFYLEQTIDGPYDIQFASFEAPLDFKESISIDSLKPIQTLLGKRDFAGVIRYKVQVRLTCDPAYRYAISIKGVSEGVRISVNGEHAGATICPPHQVDVTDLLKSGVNDVTIDLPTTLVRDQYDFFSQYMLIEPIGITGAIELLKSQK